MTDDILTMCAKAELITEDITNGYYPTVEELESHAPERLLPLVTYFSTDPLQLRDRDYRATVSWCKHYLYDKV